MVTVGCAFGILLGWIVAIVYGASSLVGALLAIGWHLGHKP